MHIIGEDGTQFDFVYVDSVFAMVDMSFHVKKYFVFEVSDSLTDLLDVIYAHLNRWADHELYSPELLSARDAGRVFQEIQENPHLQQIATDQLVQEMAMYHLGAFSLYQDGVSQSIATYDEDGETLIVPVQYGMLYIPPYVLEENLNDDFLPEEPEDPIDNPRYDFSDFNEVRVWFFMSAEQLESARQFLVQCVKELNQIYEAHGLPAIQFVGEAG